MTTMCFTPQDLAPFSAASHDRNPRHISEEYARKQWPRCRHQPGSRLTDVQWCRKLREDILKRYGGLDVLVRYTSPPIRPLPFVPEKVDQSREFITNGLARISLPISGFLGLLSERFGWNVVISSAFVWGSPCLAEC